jgi:hypothetical protein
MSEKNEKQTSELSMEELDNVAGGAYDMFLKIDGVQNTAPTPSSAVTAAPAAQGCKAGGDIIR